jgi:diadenosine tetraphosphate (Ap4A) HIT family hydrolase
MEHQKNNQHSHLTAKDRDSISFPAKFLMTRNLLKGEILDFGCGFGKDIEVLKNKGYNIQGYDKFHKPTYPKKKFDSIICLYVLNVLMPEEQAKVLIELSRLIKPTGKVYFAVRRDLKYEGFRTHKIHKKPTFQCNVKLPFNSILKNDFCEIYEYQHINQLAKESESDCPFCQPNKEIELIAESATTFALFDKFPVNNGHALIIPKRHCSNYFELSFKEQSAATFMLNEVQEIILDKFSPDGFNVGININKSAGQTISHVHIHLIPRYPGDVDNPIGGVRGVIPAKQKY